MRMSASSVFLTVQCVFDDPNHRCQTCVKAKVPCGQKLTPKEHYKVIHESCSQLPQLAPNIPLDQSRCSHTRQNEINSNSKRPFSEAAVLDDDDVLVPSVLIS